MEHADRSLIGGLGAGLLGSVLLAILLGLSFKDCQHKRDFCKAVLTDPNTPEQIKTSLVARGTCSQ